MKTYTCKLDKLPAEEVTISRGSYPNNGRTAICLTCCSDGCPFATATVNLPGEHMEPDEVAVKSYAENEGMLPFLIDNGIVAPPHRVVQSGFVTIPICRLLPVEVVQ